MERQIAGFGGLAGACVVGSRVSGRGNEFGGLSSWVVVVGGVVIGSIVSGMARRGRSDLSVVGLTFGALLGVACIVLEVGGGGGRESDGVSGVEGGGGIIIDSCSFGSGEIWAKFFPLQWACQLLSTGFCRSAAVKVGGCFFGCVLGGRLVGLVSGVVSLASLALALLIVSRSLPRVWQMLD